MTMEIFVLKFWEIGPRRLRRAPSSSAAWSHLAASENKELEDPYYRRCSYHVHARKHDHADDTGQSCADAYRPAVASQQRSGIITNNRFSWLLSEEHENELERIENYTLAIYISRNPKEGEKNRNSNATVAQQQSRVITQFTNIPVIIITDVKKINDPKYLNKIRKISIKNGERYSMVSYKITITIRVYTADIRRVIINELKKLDDELRFVARVLKSQQKNTRRRLCSSRTPTMRKTRHVLKKWRVQRFPQIEDCNSEKETINALVDAAIVLEAEIDNVEKEAQRKPHRSSLSTPPL
ncbi:hypothetical protein EVAR_39626_1 [Eumeta japonica]|uniref:Uncharacterized protein n=1 Tax=Eumeta variegata TaxID=151549 RepID=A0A4C1WI62_EUMVA|nr:hypothetical protein EVAR_39626_1 [Eumeta japonica]